MFRRVKTVGLCLSMRRILNELDAIREVVNIYPKKRVQKKEKMQASTKQAFGFATTTDGGFTT